MSTRDIRESLETRYWAKLCLNNQEITDEQHRAIRAWTGKEIERWVEMTKTISELRGDV